MITLRNKDTGAFIGSISDEDLEFLAADLEEESEDDQDYYISADTIDMMEEDGAPASLLSLLRTALGEDEGMEIEWSRS